MWRRGLGEEYQFAEINVRYGISVGADNVSAMVYPVVVGTVFYFVFFPGGGVRVYLVDDPRNVLVSLADDFAGFRGQVLLHLQPLGVHLKGLNHMLADDLSRLSLVGFCEEACKVLEVPGTGADALDKGLLSARKIISAHLFFLFGK